VNIVKIILIGTCAACIIVACATTTASSGSNSNWLAVCSDKSDCSDSLECLCGLCTKPCAAASDCSELGKSATCDRDLAAKVCGSIEAKTVCAVACQGDGDCASLGPGDRCIDGACRRVPATVSIDASTLTCLDRYNAVQYRYGDVLGAVAKDPANVACSVDADCVPAPDLTCSFGCGEPVMSQGGVAAVQAEVARLEHELCDPLSAAGCSAPVLFCPFLGPPTCVNDRCMVCGNQVCSGIGIAPPVDGGTAPSDAGGAKYTIFTCDDLTNQMGSQIESAQARADTTCASDGDCMTVGRDNRCYHACDSTPVSAAGAVEIQSTLQTLERKYCNAFDATGCPSFVPPCGASLPVKCIAHVCQFQVP
jgi:hypothetical protein